MHHQQGQRLSGDRDPADDEDGAQPHAPHHAARLREPRVMLPEVLSAAIWLIGRTIAAAAG